MIQSSFGYWTCACQRDFKRFDSGINHGKMTIFHRSLKQDFGIDNPRIAVFSLNPHAGDCGLIGSEEQTVIIQRWKK